MRDLARVVHIAWLSQVGGGELFLLDLLEAFDRSRFVHELFCLGPGGELMQQALRRGVRVTRFPKRTRFGPVTLVRLAAALRRSRPDIVQTHGEAGVFWGISATKIARLLAPNWTPRLCSLIYQNYRETRAKMNAMRLLLPSTDVVIAGSEQVRDFLILEGCAQPSQCRVIHCGIDPEAFEWHQPDDRRRLPEERPGRPILVAVGRLVERKGHAVLVRAFGQVLPHYRDAELWIVGEGPELEKLEGLASELQVHQRVRFLGTVYPTVHILRQADLFVFPSLEEPQGLALLEAFAAGVPVVASRTGGIVEMLEDGLHGSLVEPGDTDGLAEAIVGLLGDPDKRAAFVRNAQRRARDFDIRTVASRYESLYDKMCSLEFASDGEPQP